MRKSALILIVFMAFQAEVFGQLPPQVGRENNGRPNPSRPTQLPNGVVESGEADSSPQRTMIKKTKEIVNGNVLNSHVQKAVAPIQDSKYRLGVAGYKSPSGFVVWRTNYVRDFDKGGRNRCPAQEIEVDFRGNGSFTTLRLERGDIILAIDGWVINTPEDITIALDSVQTNRTAIEFIDYRTGNAYEGYFTPARIKN